ncbi:MAG: hypothetical protein EAY81_11175 [Bacteroidetes bacterium]|nr:MAG: hypothetical protein EAY81_11175 [Bacteroidota bacterium]
MKTLIKIVCLALVVMMHSSAFAQGHKKHGARKDSAMAKISERLQLTADQKTKLKGVLKQNKTEMQALRESLKTASKEDKRKAIMTQHHKNDERINAILDEKQRAEFKKIKEEKRAARKQHKKAPLKDNPDTGDGEDILNEGLL